ncbi:MAG: DUF1631 family protein [Halioglobus sp.]
MEIWEKQFPLEARIANQVRRLKPLSAAFAVTDPWFMQPGAHPLHQLLDIIQARAIGWQARLDRVGAVLEQQITRAVDDSRKWFDNKSVDLSGICAEFSAAAERDQARAQRMVQRVVEAEAGKVKTTAAKQEAARMINAALANYPAPEEIGEFIKGPWYTSAQLLLLKFGPESEQWQKMSETTATLLDSLQSMEDVDDARRQHIFALVTQLPKEMRRWLLSLHHDTEAVNEAMGLVEFTHLKILRRQALDLKVIEPIVVEGDHLIMGEARNQGPLKDWEEGQWFSVDTESDGNVRMQLVLKVEQSQQLLFTNLAGIKVLQLSFNEFIRLAEQKKVKPLASGASFSLCLAYAVGIDSVEILDSLASALADNEPMPPPGTDFSDLPDSASEEMPEPPAVQENEPELTLPLDSEATIASTEPAEEEPDLTEATSPEPELKTEAASTGEPEEFEMDLPVAPEPPLRPEQENLRLHESPQPARKLNTSSGTLFDQAQEIKARGGYLHPTPLESEDFTQRIDDQHPQHDSQVDEEAGDDKAYLVERLDHPARDSEELSVHGELDEREINLPMGAWLGFHDGEMPLMAKLAVHDTEEDYFIFVNRKGVKMRQISRLKLLQLIDNGMVDILQTNSNFRNEVTEVRKNLDKP